MHKFELIKNKAAQFGKQCELDVKSLMCSPSWVGYHILNTEVANTAPPLLSSIFNKCAFPKYPLWQNIIYSIIHAK